MKKKLHISIRRSFLTGLLALAIVFYGSEEIYSQDAERVFISPRVGMTHSTALPLPGELQFVIGHRFGDIRGGLYDVFGLDLATIRLGFDYGFNDRLAAGVGRSSSGKTYDAFAKVAFASQKEDGFPVAVTGVAGYSLNTLRGIYPADNSGLWPRSSYFVQVAVARRQGALSAQVSPILFRNNLETRLNDDLTLFALPVTASLKFTRRMAFTAQYIPVFNQPFFFGENPLSLGFDIDTGGHQFQLMFSNSTGMFEKAVLTDTQGRWLDGNIYFGFNLVRVFYLK